MELTILLVCGLFSFTMFGFFLILRGYLRTWDEYFHRETTIKAKAPTKAPIRRTQKLTPSSTPRKRVLPKSNRYTDVVVFLESLVMEGSPLLKNIRPQTGRPNLAPIYRKFLKVFPKITYQSFHGHYLTWEKSRQGKNSAL